MGAYHATGPPTYASCKEASGDSSKPASSSATSAMTAVSAAAGLALRWWARDIERRRDAMLRAAAAVGCGVCAVAAVNVRE